MNDSTMRADCERCAALCCVALAFSPSQGFAIEKSNGEVCPNLDQKNRCTIHSQRQNKGFKGCTTYDCLGAGQIVTQELFAGRSWREEPGILSEMVKAFSIMTRIQELKLLLHEASKLSLTAEKQEKLKQLQLQITPSSEWTHDLLQDYKSAGIDTQIMAFLRSLQSSVRV